MIEIEHIERSSQYLSTLLRNNADFGEWLWDRGNLSRKYPLAGLYADLSQEVEALGSFNDLLLVFRRFKQRHFLRIGARDLLGLAGFEETVGQVSDLACVALQVGLDRLMAHPEWWTMGEEVSRWAQIRDKWGLTVLGLGKLGGGELNYVSDVDLMFINSSKDEEPGDDPDDQRPVLFSKIVYGISRLLGDKVGGDRVFQVDFRLRPQGKDGILVPSLDAAAEHYLLHGRAWERQMLLKARPVAGDRSAGIAFLQEVRPFVFRRFLDFQAIDELCAMRDRILGEAATFHSAWRELDVKLGIGGIREVEFVAQSFQLIYGGRHPELDEPNTLRCLEKLCGLNLLPEKAAGELKESYIFLRNVEHYIQLDQNRQTQKLPQSKEARARLAFAMGYGGEEDAFTNALRGHCETVHGHFTALFRPERGDPLAPGREGAAPTEDVWDARGFSGPELERLKSALEPFRLHVRAAAGAVLSQYSESSAPTTREKAVLRLERFFGRVARRAGLRKVFDAPADWIDGLCRGIASSELLSDLLVRNPSLVEGIAMASGECADASEWEAVSRELLDRAKDYEEILEWLRRLKNERIVQLVLADLGGKAGFSALEDRLTAIADFTIAHTLEAVRQNLKLPPDLPLSVLGLGKLGSREMSYLSDLDLVFVYHPKEGEPPDAIPAGVIRLIQRFMNMLDTPLQEGPGYAVDARLRPTGTYGPLVVTRDSWLEYYRHQADIWEIQSLLRVRHIAGDAALGDWLEARAREICYREHEAGAVWGRLCHLRGRMQRERSEESGETVNIKLGLGGLADLEFYVQGMLLVEGWREAALHARSVRTGITEVLGRLPGKEEKAKELAAAFSALRAFDHRLRLHTNNNTGKIERGQFEEITALGLWPARVDSGPVETWEDLLRLRRTVRSFFQEVCPEV